MSGGRPLWGLLVALVLVLVPAATAGAAAAETGSVLRVGTVTTAPGTAAFLLSTAGSPAPALTGAHVTVEAAGRRLPAALAPAGPAPAGDRSAVLVLDSSGSMAGAPLTAARRAARRYADAVPADVRIGLVTAGAPARTLLAPTTDRAALVRALDSVRASGGTALYDAVAKAAAVPSTGGAHRLVVLSDGADTASATSLATLRGRLAARRGAVDVVALDARADERTLRAIAGGGRVHRADQSAALSRAFLSAAAALTAAVRVTVAVPPDLAGRTVTLTVGVRTGGRELTATAPVVFAGRATTAPAAAVSGAAAPPPWLYPAGLAALASALLLAAATLAGPGGGLGRRRLAQLTGGAARRDSGPATAPQAALALSEKVVRARGLHERITVQMEQAGLPLQPQEWLLLRVGAVLAAAVAAALLLSPPAALVLGPLAGWGGTALYRRRRAARRARRFAEQLPDALQLVVGSLRSGFSLGQSLAVLVREAEAPVSTEFGRALAETRIGVDLEDALERVAERTDCRDLSWLVMAVRVQRDVGGNLAEIMETAVETMRERARLRRHVRSLTAEGRLSAYVLIALPICLGAWMFLVRGEYVRVLYTRPIGIVLLATAVLLVVAGSWWMSRLIKVVV
ncbi:type II secretion system F family protein [Spirillospora sp. CA-253888]